MTATTGLDARVVRVDPAATFGGPAREAMNFLNEVARRHPKAVSLAAGRPPSGHLGPERIGRWLQRFVDHCGEEPGSGSGAAWLRIGQYSDTAGIIRPLVARYLEAEGEGAVDPGTCVVTNGFQEALIVQLAALAARGGAVVALDPTYVGLTGAAMAVGVPVYAVPCGHDPAAAVEAAAAVARRDGHAAVAAYLIPDYDNPTGRMLDARQRAGILAVARADDLMILEDAAYRVFGYDGERAPSLLSLDTDGRVAHLGTFSKCFLPGVRVGFSVGPTAPGTAIPDVVALKSFVSVATSPVAQAIVGGFLVEVDYRVSEWNRSRVEFCRANRDVMLTALEDRLGGVPGISWSHPRGGFFIVVDVPFRFEADDAQILAERHGVIAVPMTFFSPSGGCLRQIRLAFSDVDAAAIREGVARLAAYVRDRL